MLSSAWERIIFGGVSDCTSYTCPGAWCFVCEFVFGGGNGGFSAGKGVVCEFVFGGGKGGFSAGKGVVCGFVFGGGNVGFSASGTGTMSQGGAQERFVAK